MKKVLAFFLAFLGWSGVDAQSTLYQQEEEKAFQDALELYEKEQFAASKTGFERLEKEGLSEGRKVETDFYLAASALKLENPDGPVLLEKFILDHPMANQKNEAALTLGNHYFLARNYHKAIEAYQRAELTNLYAEERAELLFKSGYAFFQLKNYQQAVGYFEQAKRYRSEFLPDAYYYAGYVYMQQNEDAKAIRDFKEAEKSRAYAGKVPYMLASIYYRQEEYDELIAYAPHVLTRSGLDKKEGIQLLLAEAYFENRNHEQAAFYYDAYVKANKGKLNREQQYKAGVAHYHVGKYAEASNFFKEVALENDKLGQVSSYYLGHSYVKLNNPQFASNSFSTAYKQDHDLQIKEEALFNYAKVNLERGSFQDAVVALDTYLDNYPGGIHVKEAETLLSDALINTNNYLRAIEHMERMSNMSERIKAAYQKVAFYQAMVYHRDKKYAQALQFLTKSQTYPIDKELLVQSQYWKGEVLAADGRLEDAIKAYEGVINLRPSSQNPHLIKTHYGLGYAYFNSEQYAKAEAQFRAFVDKRSANPDREQYADALIRLGDTYYVQKKFDQALETFNRAIRENNPYTDYAYFRAGVIHNFENRNSQAIEQLNRVIDGFKNSRYYEDALFQKAQINMEDTNYREAIPGFSAIIENRQNSPFLPFALEGRAVAHYSLQEYDKAIEDYKAILDNHPNASNVDAAVVGLQESLTLQGRAGEFSNYLANYKKSNPGSSSLQNLEFEAAKNLFFNQSYKEAVRAFENFVRSYPNVAQTHEARFFLGDAHNRLGDTDKALPFFYEAEKAGDVGLRNRARQRIAQIEYEKENFAKAIPYLRTSAENARNKIEEFEAYSGLMRAYLQTSKYDSAIYFADRVKALGDVTVDAAPRALLTKGKALLANGQRQEAETTLRSLVDDFKTVQGAEGLYLLALSLHEKEQFEASNDLIFELSQPFGPYDLWYGRHFILLAKNYLKLNETFQAKATLESVVENSTNETVKKEANELLSTIN